MGDGQGSVRRHLRRALHQGHGGLMFNPPPAHGNPDSPVGRGPSKAPRGGSPSLRESLVHPRQDRPQRMARRHPRLLVHVAEKRPRPLVRSPQINLPRQSGGLNHANARLASNFVNSLLGKWRYQARAEMVDRYALLTTDPNAEVGAAHPKAMPVLLTTSAAWLNPLWDQANALQRPLREGTPQVVARRARTTSRSA